MTNLINYWAAVLKEPQIETSLSGTREATATLLKASHHIVLPRQKYQISILFYDLLTFFMKFDESGRSERIVASGRK
jgi:hypothetical protein